ncbi:DUF952 domain-containing protein [Nocardioides sp.]|uniref:DUF952 domain-containing protein n=1 Tax=Nocardioides sp. TaxID=35761 RepID=UPI0027183D0B|nr:DUF952 domain-containing protein [Nocardioides sp.]MDO9456773.1 DUF952 domain-containing protein [Nocardioides sp.]
MRIFHIATLADWDAARAAGRYTTSTRGRTLAEEGFIHASRGDQWQGVRQRYYADVTEPLVLLVIDTERLTSPVLDEAVPGSDETFPHVYGPVDAAAVVQTIPLDPAGPSPAPPHAAPPNPVTTTAPVEPTEPTPSFSRLYLEEVYRNLLVASAVLVVVVLCTLLGLAVDDEWGPITGAVLGLVVGVVGVRRLAPRRRA